MPTTTVQELRSATRIGVRTPVVVYSYNANGQLARSRAWTDDLSANGARITAELPLSGEQVYVRVMLPELKDQVILCLVVREIQPAESGKLFNIRRIHYGIRFTGLASDEVVNQIELLDNAALGR